MVPAAPALILLPGLDGSGRMFAAFERSVTGDRRTQVVRYAPDTPAVLDAYVEHALEQLPHDGKLALIAESFSGPVAVKLAHRLDDRLIGIVLCASFVTPPHSLLSLARCVPTSGVELGMQLSPLLRRYCLDVATDSAVFAELAATLRSTSGRVVRERLNLLAELDIRTEWHQLRTPALVLQASGDRLVTQRAREALVRNAGSRSKIIHVDGPHFLLQARPQACWQAIARWLNQLQLPGTVEAT